MEHVQHKVEEPPRETNRRFSLLRLSSDPPLIILDEPLADLHPINQELLKDIFLELNSGEAVIFSTTRWSGEKLSDEICLINHGKVVVAGALRM